MKSILLVIAMFAFAACSSNESKISYSQSIDNNGVVNKRMVVKNPQSDIDIKMEGKVGFSDDGTTITSLSENGFIKYRSNDVNMIITNEGNILKTVIKQNNNKIPQDSETGKKILQEVTQQVKQLQKRNS